MNWSPLLADSSNVDPDAVIPLDDGLPPVEYGGPLDGLLGLFCFGGFGIGSIIFTALMIWMLIHCLRNDPDRYIWFWVILVFQPFGALIYLFVRFLPQLSNDQPALFKRFSSGKEIRRLQINADRIGNAHQFVELGEGLLAARRYAEARDAFSQALEKESDNLPALWGGACADHALEEIPAACEKLNRLMQLDRTYKFGDASILHGKCLIASGEKDAARDHLQLHTKKWRHPEALYLLAELCIEQGDDVSARDLLEGIIADLDSSPRAIARKSMHWKGKARSLLKKLPG